MNIRRICLTLGTSAILVAGGVAGPAFAVSPSERDCEGTFDRTRGEVSCTVVDPVGNSEKSPQDRSQTRDKEETGQGNLSNKEQDCVSGPGNQSTCP